MTCRRDEWRSHLPLIPSRYLDVVDRLSTPHIHSTGQPADATGCPLLPFHPTTTAHEALGEPFPTEAATLRRGRHLIRRRVCTSAGLRRRREVTPTLRPTFYWCTRVETGYVTNPTPQRVAIMYRLPLALIGLVCVGSLAPALPAAHAQVATPAISARTNPVQVGGSARVVGRHFTPNNWASVSFQRPDGTVGAFRITTGKTGRFAFLLGFKAAHGCGTETLWARDRATRNRSAPMTVTVTGCGTPAAPSDLRVLSTSVSSALPQPATVTLQWRDNSSSETGFRIRTTITRFYGGTDTQTQETGANATTAAVNFIAGGFNPVKAVCFAVTAFNATSESAPSNSTCVQLSG